MSKLVKKMNIKEAMVLCGYNNNIKQNFVQFLQSNYSNPKNKLFLFERSLNVPKLFLLQLKIPAKYNNNTYDISILVYFPLNFPFAQPDIFFHKYCSVKINPNCLNYVDEETLRINYNKFFNWGNSLESFKNLIKEIYNQFNKNFPIFTFDKENDDGNDDGDCILREECCKEIELRRPLVNNKSQKNNRRPLKNLDNNNKIKISEFSDINENNSSFKSKDKFKNNISLKHNVKNDHNLISRNIKINNNDNSYSQNNTNNKSIDNNNNNNNQINNNIINKDYNNNTNQINNNIINKDYNSEIPFDEDISKKSLTQLLISQLYPKINRINISVKNTNNNLNKMKNNIISEIKEFDEIEKQKGNVEKSINLVKKELESYDNAVQSDKNFDENKKDFSNLDTLLNVKNKNYYVLLSKEKAIEEYLLIIKKSYEKHFLDLHTSMDLVRRYSRLIFNIKYKCNNLTKKNI